MNYIDTNLYDIHTGKYTINMLYSDLTLNQHLHFNQKINEYNITNGISCKKIDTHDKHFNYNVHFFTNYVKTETNKDIAVSFSTEKLINVTNNFLLQNRNSHTSLEFFGYFKSPTTGIYNFKISTGDNDSSLLWIGDDALVNYSTENIISDNKSTSLTVKIVKDRYYPIRIQYGTYNSNKSPYIQIDIISDHTSTPLGPIDNYLFSINYMETYYLV